MSTCNLETFRRMSLAAQSEYLWSLAEDLRQRDESLAEALEDVERALRDLQSLLQRPRRRKAAR